MDEEEEDEEVEDDDEEEEDESVEGALNIIGAHVVNGSASNSFVPGPSSRPFAAKTMTSAATPFFSCDKMRVW